MSRTSLRLSVLVFSIGLVGVILFARPQESATLNPIQVARIDPTAEPLKEYEDIPSIAFIRPESSASACLVDTRSICFAILSAPI
jgi:hypothetical protein